MIKRKKNEHKRGELRMHISDDETEREKHRFDENVTLRKIGHEARDRVMITL